MTDTRGFDIIVVGAGPAGITAATAAVKGGRPVCLLERRPHAGAPVRCGEGIGLKGFALGLEMRPEWVLTPIKNARLVSPSGIAVTIKGIPESFIIDRDKMERDLVDELVAAGATFAPNSPVTKAQRLPDGTYACTTPSGEYRSRCLIIADGVESRVARDLGWQTSLRVEDVETCAIARVSGLSLNAETIEMFLGAARAPSGYVWVFPRSSTEANVGLGVLGSRSTAGKARLLLRQFIATRFPGATVSHEHCGGVPMGTWTSPLVRGGAMLVGDAARQVNAVAGAGIAYSLIAGKSAGTVAAQAFVNGVLDESALREYHDTWASHYGKQQHRSYALKQMIVSYDDAMLDTIARTLSREKPGKISYLKLFLTAFSKHPILMFKAYKLFR
jgi:digeranylgeranylglycerophospholipid reductase